MDRNLLRYPNKSHRKIVCLPRNSALLAEFLGIEFGDGGIGNPWQIVITLNAITDKDYSQYVSKLIRKLFGITPVIRKRKKENTLQIVISSVTIVDFIVSKGAIRGNKIKQNIDIPLWIHSKKEYEKAFIRGLIDTDGGLYIHRHTTKGILYNNIGFCFTSSSPSLLKSVANIFYKFGITPHIVKNKRIFLYGEKNVGKYLDIFGSSNKRIINKYRIWRGAGVV